MKVRSRIETNGHASFKKWRSIYSETSSVNGPSGRILGYRETRRNTETQYTQSGCTTRRGRFSMCSCRPREKERERTIFSCSIVVLYFSRELRHTSRSLSLFFFLFLKSKRLSKAARTAYNRYRSRDRNSFTLFNVVVIVVVVVLREWKHERDGIDEYRCARCKVELFMGRLERVFCVIQF